MKKLSIIIPMYNEQEVATVCYKRIKKVLDNIREYDYEIIIIDDGSKDKTLKIISEIAKTDNAVKVISFSRNFGHQAAVTAGLKESKGDAVVIIDADMQDPPEIIADMIELWEQGNEVIYAVRSKRKGESILKTVTAKMFYKILYSLSNIEIPKDTGDFRLVDRKVVDVINSLPEHNKYLRGLFSWVGFKQVPIKYIREERIAGKTKYPFKKMLKLAYDGIVGFSNKPLKIIGMLGGISILLAFAILIYTICSYIFKWNNLVPGWASIMVSITFFSGIQLISVWVISEYISRIYDEAQDRPEYIIKRKIKNGEIEE